MKWFENCSFIKCYLFLLDHKKVDSRVHHENDIPERLECHSAQLNPHLFLIPK